MKLAERVHTKNNSVKKIWKDLEVLTNEGLSVAQHKTYKSKISEEDLKNFSL